MHFGMGRAGFLVGPDGEYPAVSIQKQSPYSGIGIGQSLIFPCLAQGQVHIKVGVNHHSK